MSRILIIDDEQPLRRMLRSLLEREGHTVFDASDGREATDLCRTEPVDLVVTDLFMPRKDGVEFICGLRHSRRKPKIIAMSGSPWTNLFELDQAVRLMGADRFLSKPFDQQALLFTIQEVLNGQA